MPKPSLHLVTWSEERQHYQLYTRGHLQQSFRREDEQIWHDWLAGQRSFSFQGQYGHMSVIKEVRSRRTSYWYAYRSIGSRTMKRYLGQSARLTLAQLEEKARALTTEHSVPQPMTVQTFPAPPFQEPLTNYIPMLETKLSHPRLPATFIERERLLCNIDTVLEHQLLLLSSSAGSGKTTLLSAWVARSAQSLYTVRWLSLDEFDDDPTHFWASVIVTLHTCLPEISDLTLAMLSTPQPPPFSTLLTTLLNGIRSYSHEIVLILDDYHVIEEQIIHDAMLFLLDHLPSNLHLIISTRIDPPFPLARWRVRGQMTELRETDVRFTHEEAFAFLTQNMKLSLSKDEIEILEHRTEGWIAGLQLAARALSAHESSPTFVQSFSGGHRFILDYVQEEILQKEPLPMQRFLLQIAILNRMNASLCQAITGEPASQEVLEMLERRNLFVVPLDEQQQWYRLHSLFREVLLTRIQATQPELIPYLHQRAARWYEKQGFLHEAMAHALAAKDYFFAALIMEHGASQFWMKGEAKTIARWVLLLPDDVFRTHMGFALTSALYLLSSVQSAPEQQRALALVQSEQIIARVEQALKDQKETSFSQSEVKRLQSRISMLHGLVDMIDALRTGAMQQVRSLAQQMQPLVIHEPIVWKWFPLYGLFVSAQFLGDSVLLLPELLAMKQEAFQEQERATASVVLCWIAAAYLYAGKLRLLQQECFHAQDLLEQAGKPVAVAAYPAFDLSFLYYERNQLEQAEASLQSAIHQASLWQDMNLLVWGNATRVKVFLAAGKIEEAQEALQQAQLLMQQSGLSMYASDVMAAQVALWLAQGNLSAAEAWTTHADLDPRTQDYIRQEEYMALARVYLAQQHYEHCLHLLVPLLNRMERVERHWDIIHLLALQVAALFGLEKMAQARQVAIRLLALTEPEGYIRVYLDSGEPMRHILLSLLDTPHHDGVMLSATYLSYISMLLTAFEQEKHRDAWQQAASGTENNQLASQNEAHPQETPYEPLSPQERRVLSLLVAGQTYAEIARELVVSPNTIKTQVSSIYRKLGVSRRAQASMLARQLHLL